MSLTPQELALRLGKFLGITSLDPNDPTNIPPTFQRGLQPGDVEELAACINAALQEIWELMPTALRFARYGLELPGPTSVTLELAQGSTAITAFGGYAAWMNGCTVEVAGERNEIVDATTLRHPYTGVSGAAIPATVLGDAATPAPGAVSVLEPLSIGAERVAVVDTAAAFEAIRSRDPGRRGVPEVCWVETRVEPPVPLLAVRMRFHPLPERPMRLVYGARLNVPSTTAADLQSPTPVPAFPIPHGWDEAVLLPLAVSRLSLHPDFLLNANHKTELPRQTAAARRIVESARPARNGGVVIPVFR